MSTPSICVLLANWWGGTWENFAFLAELSSAGNIFVGNNPLYQVSDFLAFYPKFGIYAQAISAAAINAAGTGYTAGDILVPVQQDSSGAQITVNTVDGSGHITGVTVTTGGTGYQAASAVAVTGGTGTGAKFNLTLVPFVASAANIPLVIIQAYVTLANACLQKARWFDQWQIAMSLFVAHYLTLYLRSEGAMGTTPQQIASQGLALGLAASQAAGDVSQSTEYFMNDAWMDWGAWNLTLYGQQLITMAKIIGMGPMYIW